MPKEVEALRTSLDSRLMALEKALAPYHRSPFRWARTEPTLEDVFIHLMSRVQDNFQ